MATRELIELTDDQRESLQKLLLGRVLVTKGPRAWAWRISAWLSIAANLVIFSLWRSYDFRLSGTDSRVPGFLTWAAGTVLLVLLYRYLRRRAWECSVIQLGPTDKYLARSRRRWWWLTGRRWIVGGVAAFYFGAAMSAGAMDDELRSYVDDFHGTTLEEFEYPELRVAEIDQRAREIGVNIGSALIVAGMGAVIAGATAKRRQTRQLLGGPMLPIISVAQGRRVSSDSFSDGLDSVLASYGHPSDRSAMVGPRTLGWGQIELAKNAYRLTEDPQLVGEFARTLLRLVGAKAWDHLPERIKDATLDGLAAGSSESLNAFDHGMVSSLPAFWVPSAGDDAAERLISVADLGDFVFDPRHTRAEVYDKLVQLTGGDTRFDEAGDLCGEFDFSDFKRRDRDKTGRFPFDRRAPSRTLRAWRFLRLQPRPITSAARDNGGAGGKCSPTTTKQERPRRRRSRARNNRRRK